MTLYLADEHSLGAARAYASLDGGAKVFLLQDAVYGALKNDLPGEVYVLDRDVARRGLGNAIKPPVKVVGYADLVGMMEDESVVNLL